MLAQPVGGSGSAAGGNGPGATNGLPRTSPVSIAGGALRWRLGTLTWLSSPFGMEFQNLPSKDDITGLLQLWRDGDERAFDRLVPLVYDQLHRMALGYLAGERAAISLQATGLVNEICVRLLGWDQARWQTSISRTRRESTFARFTGGNWASTPSARSPLQASDLDV